MEREQNRHGGPVRAVLHRAVTPADCQGGGGQTPAFFPPGPAAGTDAGSALAGMVVHRLFGVGLTLQSAAGLAGGPVAERLQQAVDELDAIIRDVRTAAFKFQDPGHSQ
jgi:hypothetical protein